MAIPTPQQTIISTGTDPALATYGNALGNTAYISGGNVTYNITQIEEITQNNSLTNNFNNTAGGTSGQIQFNYNGVLSGDSGFVYNPNNDTVTVAGNVVTANVTAANVVATTSISTAGNITAPIVTAGNLRTDNLQYANGDSYVFTAVTGNITFDQETMISTGNMYLQPFIENASSIDIYLTGGTDIHMASAQSGDMLYLGNDSTYVRLNSSGAVDIQSYDSGAETSYSWNFATGGNITLPSGAILGDTFGDGGTTLLSPAGMYAELASADGNVFAWVSDTGYSSYEPGFYIATNSEAEPYRWAFNSDGSMTFPGNKIDTGNQYIDIKSTDGVELWYHNSDIANAATGDTTGSYSWVNGNGAGTAIETKDSQTYVWLQDKGGSTSVPADIVMGDSPRQAFGVIVNTDTGVGYNLQVNIEWNSAGDVTVTGITDGGSAYDVGDSIYILGSAYGGHNELNDVYFTVAAIGAGGSIPNAGSLTIDTSYNHALNGITLNGGSVISGTDATGNVTIQTFNQAGPSVQNYTFTNSGNIESSRSLTLTSHNNVGMYWYNNDAVNNTGDYYGTNVYARSACASISTSFYDIGDTAVWRFTGDGTLTQPGTISMQGQDRYYTVGINTDTGSGSDLRLVVTLGVSGGVTIVGINNGGQYYNTGDQLYIDGTNIGGHSTNNRITIEVLGVGIGGVIENYNTQLAITGGYGPKLGLEFTNYAAIQTDDDANGNIVIQTFNTDEQTPYYYSFGNQGTITVSDGAELKTAMGSTGSMTIHTDASSGVEVEVFLSHDEAVFINTHGGDYNWIFNSFGNLTVPGSISSGQVLEIFTQNNSGSSINLYTDWDSGVGVTMQLNHNSNVTIGTAGGGQNWVFDNAGNLNIPSGSITSSAGGFNINVADGTEGDIDIYTAWGVDHAVEVWLAHNEAVYITTADGANQWEFKLDGSTVMPGNVDMTSGTVLMGAQVKTTVVAFGDLPDAVTAGAGTRAFINNANVSTFGSEVGGGGSNVVPIFSNGTIWCVG